MINKQSNITSNYLVLVKRPIMRLGEGNTIFPWDFEFSEDEKDHSTAPKAHHPTLILFIMNSENSEENQIFISSVKHV